MNCVRRPGGTRQRRTPLTILAVVLIFAGCGNDSANKQAKPEFVQGLRVQRIQLQAVPDEMEAPGSVIASATAQVGARTMGTVLAVAVKEGDSVQRGQLLAQLDERELAARRNAALAAVQSAEAGITQAIKAVAVAQAHADMAQKTFDRFTYLKEQKSVSLQEFDEVTAKQQASQAALEQARAGLRQAQAGREQAQSEAHAAESVSSYARIVAPFAGRVERRTVEAGSLVSPGMPLFVVEDSSRYQLEVTLPAESARAVKKGGAARVQLDGFIQKVLAGTVTELEPGADSLSHTIKARIDLPRESGIQSGMFGRAFFAQGEKRAMVAPRESLVQRGQLHGVYTVDPSGLVSWRVVTLGKETGDQVEILSGLAEGDALVLNPGPQELDGKKTAAPPDSGGKRP